MSNSWITCDGSARSHPARRRRPSINCWRVSASEYGWGMTTAKLIAATTLRPRPSTAILFPLMYASLRLSPVVLLALGSIPPAPAQTPVDPALAAYIATIKAIDNHAHPMRPVAAGQAPDSEYDALPLDGIPPFPLPWRLTLESPVWAAARRGVYGAGDPTRIRAVKGKEFPSWALDRAGIETMFANRIAMGAGLPRSRFRWVPFDDALLFPLAIDSEASRTPDTRSLYPREAALLRRYLRDLGRESLPPTIDEYLTDVLIPTLRRQRDGGAIAIKFEI